MREGIVNERGPEERKDEEAAEFHPFGEGAGDQRRRDDREHGLEDHKGLVGHRRAIIGVRLQPHAVQPEPFETADDVPLIRTERQAVAPQDPLHADETENNKTLHDGTQRVLLTDHTGIE